MGVVQRLLELVVDARNADLAAEDAAAAAASAGGWSAAGRGGRRAADGGGGGRWTAPAGAGTDATFLRAAVEHARLADALRPYNEKVAARAGGGRGGRANAAGPDGDAVDEGNPYARIFRDYMAGVPRGPLDAVLASEARLWGMMRDAGARLVGPPGPPEAEPDDPTAAAGAALVSATLRRRRVAEEEELLRLALHAERRHRAPILRLGLAAQVELEAAGCTLWSADARDALWGVLTRRPQRASLAAVRQALWETEGPAVAAAVDHLFRDPTDAAAHLPDPPVGPAGGGGTGGSRRRGGGPRRRARRARRQDAGGGRARGGRAGDDWRRLGHARAVRPGPHRKYRVRGDRGRGGRGGLPGRAVTAPRALPRFPPGALQAPGPKPTDHSCLARSPPPFPYCLPPRRPSPGLPLASDDSPAVRNVHPVAAHEVPAASCLPAACRCDLPCPLSSAAASP